MGLVQLKNQYRCESSQYMIQEYTYINGWKKDNSPLFKRYSYVSHKLLVIVENSNLLFMVIVYTCLMNVVYKY